MWVTLPVRVSNRNIWQPDRWPEFASVGSPSVCIWKECPAFLPALERRALEQAGGDWGWQVGVMKRKTIQICKKTKRNSNAYLVFGYVDQQFGLEKLFEYVLGRHVGERLLGGWGHAHLNHDDRTRDVLFLHTLTVVLYRFDADLRFVRKEHKHLIWTSENFDCFRLANDQLDQFKYR